MHPRASPAPECHMAQRGMHQDAHQRSSGTGFATVASVLSARVEGIMSQSSASSVQASVSNNKHTWRASLMSPINSACAGGRPDGGVGTSDPMPGVQPTWTPALHCLQEYWTFQQLAVAACC